MSDKDTHTYLEVNGDFRMRELDHNDLEQFNALLQYAFQVTSYELFQTGWEQEEIKYAKRPILEDAYVLGWFYKEKLASMIVVYSMQINIQDTIMAMGGITGVTTYPNVSAWIPRIFITYIPILPCSTTVHSSETGLPGMNTGAGKMMI